MSGLPVTVLVCGWGRARAAEHVVERQIGEISEI